MITAYVANKCPVVSFDPIGCSYEDFNRPPIGENLGEFETRTLAFKAINDFVASIGHLIPAKSRGLPYTFTKNRPDGLYVAYFDGLIPCACIEFVLIYSSNGGDG